MSKISFLSFVAFSLISTSAVAQLRFDLARTDPIEVYGNVADVDFYCSSVREQHRFMSSELCEQYTVRPTQFDRVIGRIDPEIKRVVLERDGKKWEFNYLGRKGYSAWFDLVPLMENGYLTFSYKLLGALGSGGRKPLEEGEFSIWSKVELNETGWPETFEFKSDESYCYRMAARDMCERYFSNRPGPMKQSLTISGY